MAKCSNLWFLVPFLAATDMSMPSGRKLELATLCAEFLFYLSCTTIADNPIEEVVSRCREIMSFLQG
jgi:hypothetical protein